MAEEEATVQASICPRALCVKATRAGAHLGRFARKNCPRGGSLGWARQQQQHRVGCLPPLLAGEPRLKGMEGGLAALELCCRAAGVESERRLQAASPATLFLPPFSRSDSITCLLTLFLDAREHLFQSSVNLSSDV